MPAPAVLPEKMEKEMLDAQPDWKTAPPACRKLLAELDSTVYNCAMTSGLVYLLMLATCTKVRPREATYMACSLA